MAKNPDSNNLASVARFDWKALGYLVSIVSVFLLGTVAWPKPADPKWHLPVLVAGMATSILGMGLRWMAHVRQQERFQRIDAKLGASTEA